MKKLTVCLMATFLSLTFIPVQLRAGTESVHATTLDDKTANKARANTLLSRLDEIKKLDKSEMKSAEKRGLRKEVRSIKKELKELEGGIYISVGALLIIILLIIIL